MHGCNCLLLAVDASDVLLHVDSVSSELMELIVREHGTGSGVWLSCGVMVSLFTVM